MSIIRRAGRNLGALTVAQVIARLSGLFVTALLARHLGGDDFGSYSLCINFACLFGVLASLGMRQIVIRNIIQSPEGAPRTVGSAIGAYAIQGAVTVATIIVVAKLFGYHGTKLHGIMIMSLTVVFMAYEALFYAVFEADERMDIEALFVLLRQGIWVGLAAVGFLTDQGYLMFLAALLATAAFIAMVAGLVTRRNFCRFPFVLHGQTTLDLLRTGLPLAGAAILVDIYLRVDMIMLDQMLNNLAVGLYGASYRLVQSMLFLSGSFFIVIYPIFNRLQKEDPQKLASAYERSLKSISLALVPLAAGTSALAEPIMRLLYGEEFVPGSAALSVAVWGVPLYGLAVIMGRLLLTLHRQQIIFYVSLLSMILNIGLNYLLIPEFGIRGAAVASVVTIACVAVLNYLALSRHLRRPHMWALLWKVCLAGLLMGSTMWLMRDFSLWLLVPGGAVLYGVLILLLRALDDTDWAMLRELVRRREQ